MTYVQHPLSAAFPAMKADELQDLRDSIGNIGVQNPITLFEGMVLDGWHRYSVATEFGMACPEVELDPLTDAREFVLAQNKARRHVTAGQLAMATTAVYAWRPSVGGRPPQTTGAQCQPQEESSKPGTECRVLKSSAELAEIAGVGERTIRQAKAVQTHGAPEVVEAVRSGAIGLPTAAALAQLPVTEQVAALNTPAESRVPKRPSKEQSAVDPRDQRIAALEEEVTLLREQLADSLGDLAVVMEAVDPDERLAAALREAQEQRSLCRNLQLRIDSLVNEVGEAKRQAAYWKRKAEQPA